MKPANFAPIYVGLYPELAEITRKHGYALAAHGTLARDFDLICIPWVENPNAPSEVISEITSIFSLKLTGEPKPLIKEHGRIVYTLILSFGECFLDFSFMPLQPVKQQRKFTACFQCKSEDNLYEIDAGHYFCSEDCEHKYYERKSRSGC